MPPLHSMCAVYVRRDGLHGGFINNKVVNRASCGAVYIIAQPERQAPMARRTRTLWKRILSLSFCSVCSSANATRRCASSVPLASAFAAGAASILSITPIASSTAPIVSILRSTCSEPECWSAQCATGLPSRTRLEERSTGRPSPDRGS